MGTAKDIPPLPPVNEPLIDLRTGKVTPRWYEWLIRLDMTQRDQESRIATLEP